MNRRQFLLTSAASAFLAAGAEAQYQPQARELVNRLAAAQAEDGALLMPGKGSERVCNPYFANLAVLGMLSGAPPRNRVTAATVARKWIGWYVAHINPNGTIDDHAGAPNALKPTGKFDSSDAYAGTFLSLLLTYFDQASEARAILDPFSQVLKIAEAPVLTLQKSGLTHARPDYPVAYLMDNVEVWHGWDSLAKLCTRLKRRDEAKTYRERADALLPAIDEWLWNPMEGSYAWAIHPGGKRETGIQKWYPNLMANLMALALLPPDDRRNDLYLRLFREGEPLPKKIETVEQLEKLLWWGLASLPRQTTDVLERFQVRLASFPWEKNPDLNPALLGHALRLGGWRTAPSIGF